MSGPTGHRLARVGVHLDSNEDAAMSRASRLARELALPPAEGDGAAFDLLLVVGDERLALRETGRGSAGPVYADFLSPRLNPKAGFGGGRRQLLGRAVGVTARAPTVVDATAGLGRDAFRLALLGCAVTACERSPVAAALLRDGIDRARSVPRLDDMLARRFRLIVADAREALGAVAARDRPDVVFLDPMYPVTGHASARVKKEMRIFRMLVGDDNDAESLLVAARAAARRRVVVKRMRHSPPLGPEPDIVFKGKIARYDVYLTQDGSRVWLPRTETAQIHGASGIVRGVS